MMPILVPLGVKFTVTSNILSLMKEFHERSFFNVKRVEMFVPVLSSELSDHPFKNLMLCSWDVSYEQYLIFLVYGSHHLFVALMLV